MSENKKIINIKKTKFFWLYFIPSAIFLVLGLFLMPIWNNVDVFWANWSNKALSIILFCIVLLYIILLVKNIDKKGSKLLLRFKIAEIVLLAVVAVLCILNQFGIIHFVGPCFVFGAIFYLRGCLYIANGYIKDGRNKEKIITLIVAVILITLGTLLMTNPISIPVFIWIISIFILVIALILLILGFITKPKKEKHNKQEKKD